ncbi:MAG: VWA domain-containing protein [Alphaproteobacteria bacterium]|nr:VWA domain-containing protein [Alphaproteobacteria bacterium]
MINLAYPEMLWLLLLPFVSYYVLPIAGKMYGDALKVPFINDIIKIKEQSKTRKYFQSSASKISWLGVLGLAIVWGLSVLALCRPQWVGEPLKIRHEGRDIMLVADISTSMNERDFRYQNRYYTRLEAVKSVVSRFADERTEDRIGLVLFGTRAYMQVPLTYDRQSLKEVLYSVDAGMAGNSTSIGDAVGVALKNLTKEDTKNDNKMIILLTDGENNDGRLSFPQAIKLAEQEKIKIYTIGAESDSEPFFGGLFSIPANQGIDEEGLKYLANVTKGRYFRAKDVQSLAKIYDEINKLEAQEQEGRFVQETKDLYYYPAGIALLLFLLMFSLLRKV